MKTSRSIESIIQPGKGRVRDGDDGRAKNNSSEMCNSKVDSGEVKDNEVEKKSQKTSKSKKLSKSKKTIGFLDFFILGIRLVFIKLRQTFVKTPIFHHFDPKCYILVKTNILNYAISEIFSYLILDDLG